MTKRIIKKNWNRLYNNITKVIGEEEIASRKPDLFCIIPICIGTKEAPTTDDLEDIIMSIRDQSKSYRKIDYRICLYPYSEESLAQWYEDNQSMLDFLALPEDSPADKIVLESEWRQTPAWQRHYDRYMQYRTTGDITNRDSKLLIDANKFIKRHKEADLEYSKKHVIKDAVDLGCFSEERIEDLEKSIEDLKKSIESSENSIESSEKSIEDNEFAADYPRATALIYKQDSTNTISDLILNYENIGYDKKKSLLFYVQYKLENVQLENVLPVDNKRARSLSRLSTGSTSSSQSSSQSSSPPRESTIRQISSGMSEGMTKAGSTPQDVALASFELMKLLSKKTNVLELNDIPENEEKGINDSASTIKSLPIKSTSPRLTPPKSSSPKSRSPRQQFNDASSVSSSNNGLFGQKSLKPTFSRSDKPAVNQKTASNFSSVEKFGANDSIVKTIANKPMLRIETANNIGMYKSSDPEMQKFDFEENPSDGSDYNYYDDSLETFTSELNGRMISVGPAKK